MTIRLCVCGDEGTGKSSLITSLVKDSFVTSRIQPILPQITIPPTFGSFDDVTTTIVDTSAAPQERETLNSEIRKSNVILLVYSDHYSYERVGLFWLPHFRSLGVNVPVVLCANKLDLLAGEDSTPQIVEDEMLPLMTEFKEIDSCIRASAREHRNVNEAFFLCQKAVTHPIAPLYDSKDSNLKPAAVTALKRIFYLMDRDQDGWLSDAEMQDFQQKCFKKMLSPEDLSHIKKTVSGSLAGSAGDKGIDQKGFLLLNKLYAEKGRHETIWIILRAFNYSDSLSLKESFLHPKLEIPAHASTELSPSGYQFLFDLFLLFDKDNDGGLNNAELAALFAPTPGLPATWLESSFPLCTVRNDAGHVTLQGWLAQWSMTTFTSPKTTLEYLAYFGFEPTDTRLSTASALKITKPRKRTKRSTKPDRNVVQAYIIGSSGCGKSSLLDAFLSRPFNSIYHPTINSRTAVNSVELPGGKQCYLILTELGQLEPAVLDNPSRLEAADLIIYTYDSSDPDSFNHIVAQRTKYPHLASLPALFIACKADQDKTNQRTPLQPDAYATEAGLYQPLHVSATWSHSVSELFVRVAEVALNPSSAFVKSDNDGNGSGTDRMGIWLAVGAFIAAGAAFVGIWKRMSDK
ncbi:MAG: ERMES complex Ca(2+)-binding regulatory GTPase gem1 [Gomphillus americanus]|uniref:Mitochondrial Rho GTPase n=1 Tax=Gomphillus americanus TaxID=1940652 RepID=A0A8H3I4F6_9LECA|nr:MAG: ERMES complex Ca(2+)-binding regulatory GTPase gem1 [Gomphillus americanus]